MGSGMKITFESNSKQVKHVMTQLERKALRESGKVIRKAWRKEIPKDSGDTRKSLGTWIRKDRGGMQIGIYNKRTATKKKKVYVGFRYHIIEFGSRYVRGLSPLRNAVFGNIAEIIAAQAKFLPYLEDEARALAVINEEEVIDDED